MQRRNFLSYALSALAATTYGQPVYSAQPPPPGHNLLAKKLQPGMTIGVIAPSSAPLSAAKSESHWTLSNLSALRPSQEKISTSAEAIWLGPTNKEQRT